MVIPFQETVGPPFVNRADVVSVGKFYEFSVCRKSLLSHRPIGIADFNNLATGSRIAALRISPTPLAALPHISI
jgi:hypothetical protein